MGIRSGDAACAESSTVDGSFRCTHVPRQKLDLARTNRLLRSRRFEYQELAVVALRGFCFVAHGAVSLKLPPFRAER